MSESCPLYSQEMDEVVNDFEVQSFYAQFSSACEYMEKNSNLEMGKKTVIKSTTLLYDALLVEVNTKRITLYINKLYVYCKLYVFHNPSYPFNAL